MEVLCQLSYSPDLGRLRLPTTGRGSQRAWSWREVWSCAATMAACYQGSPINEPAGGRSVVVGLPVEFGNVAVEPFDLVVGTDLVAEHVDDSVAVVDQHPLLLGHAFDPQW